MRAMTTPLRPVESGVQPHTSTTVDPRAGTRVALGFPLVAAVVTFSWLIGSGAQPEFSFWTFLVLPAICAAYGLFPVVIGSRSIFSFEIPTIILAGLLGGPLAGALAGVASGLGDVGAVWRRRTTYAGLAVVQGFAAGLAGQAWLAGRISLPAAVVLASLSSLALGFAGRTLVVLDRRSWPTPWLLRGLLLELAELLTAAPFLVLLAGSFSASPGLVSLAVGSALATIAFVTWTLTSERSPVELERHAQLLDPLTGALSRVAFEAALAREHQRVLRGERSAGLLVCDLDHFGRFNERYGHLGGDRALRFAVEQIQAAARAGDLVARWGGEEICLITPGIGSLAELEELCERVRRSVSGAALAVEDERVSLTISIGATLLTDWSTPEETFARADEALYLAKRTRDAVCVLAPRLPGGERTAWALAGA